MSAIDEIERQLLKSVAARAQTPPHPPVIDNAVDPRLAAGARRRSPRTRWSLLRGWRIGIVLAAMALAGGAAVAAVLLDEQSAPLVARVPAGQQPGYAVAGGYRYRIALVPALQVGQIGWCAAISTSSRTGRPEDLGTGSCDDAPTDGAPLFAPQLGQGLSFVFTTPSVHAVQLPGHRPVLTTSSADLPFGYRAAVFEYVQPTGRAAAPPNGEQFGLAALNPAGRRIPYNGSGTPIEPVAIWGHAQTPVAGSCSVTATRGAPLTFGVGSVVTAVVPAPHVVGGAFLPCLERNVRLNSSPTTTFPISERVMQIYVLLNAQVPTRPAPALPYMHSLAGHPGVLDNASLPLPDALSNGMTARRIGDAWLVVIGGRSTQQRLDVLEHIRLGRVDLREASAATTTSHGCTISYRNVGGLVETSQLTGSAAQLGYAEDRVCDSLSFYYQDRWPLTAAVALSVTKCQAVPYIGNCAPATRFLRLRPVGGHANEYTVSVGGMDIATIERLGRAWLIVSGGQGAGQQELLLSRISIQIATNLLRSLVPTRNP